MLPQLLHRALYQSMKNKVNWAHSIKEIPFQASLSSFLFTYTLRYLGVAFINDDERKCAIITLISILQISKGFHDMISKGFHGLNHCIRFKNCLSNDNNAPIFLYKCIVKVQRLSISLLQDTNWISNSVLARLFKHCIALSNG